jgi:hypothetical protein
VLPARRAFHLLLVAMLEIILNGECLRRKRFLPESPAPS